MTALAWRRSSKFEQGACVEVAWTRSSWCEGASCVEVGHDLDEILVRDGKDPGGPILRFTAEEWTAFVAGVRAGEFD